VLTRKFIIFSIQVARLFLKYQRQEEAETFNKIEETKKTRIWGKNSFTIGLLEKKNDKFD